jgi:membrane fusion protein, multidrug efflux system
LAAGVFLSGCSRDKPATPTTATAADASKAAAAPAIDASKTPPAADAAKSAAVAGKSAGDPAAKTTGPATVPGAPNQAAGPAAKRAMDAEKDKARQAAAEMVPVETALVTRGAISKHLPYNSTLETESTVDIFPQTAGQVEALLVEEGRIVKAGDALLKIEDRELRLDVEETTANYEHIKTNFSRIEDLYKRNLVNKQDYEDQRFQAEQARIRHDRAKVKLEYATVRAPFDGVISARETQVGARVSNGTKVFSMVKLDDLVARVFVPGKELSVVAENQPAVVTSDFLPDRNFEGWVKRISPVIDPKSGTFKVTVGVRGAKLSELPPGLFVTVRIVTDTRPNAVLIPKRAVVYEGGERYVFTVEKGKAVKKKLIPGYDDPTNIEALSGFEVGTSVIVLGQSGLKDGQMVRSVNATPAVMASGAPTAGKAAATMEKKAPEPIIAPVPAPATTSTVEPAKPNKS